MHYRRLGRSGLKVSEISLGAWLTFGNQIDEHTASEMIHDAYNQGVNFFDNADVYANGQAEEVIGRAIRDLPRSELILSSKAFFPTSAGPNGRGLSRKHLIDSVNQSLRRLGTDYLDLFFCHRYDPDTPIEEVVQTMDILIRQGKVLYWGTSEWDASQIVQAYGVARQNGWVQPTMESPQYNLFHRERVEESLAPICKEFGLGLTTWSPLSFGVLSGKYNEGIPDGSRASLPDMGWIRDQITPERVAVVRQLTAMATELDMTTAQLAIAWILRRKDVSCVIIGATRSEQLDENLGAADGLSRMSDEVFEQIDILVGCPEEE
jgi:voltage-dependent potassium channel beta subunit